MRCSYEDRSPMLLAGCTRAAPLRPTCRCRCRIERTTTAMRRTNPGIERRERRYVRRIGARWLCDGGCFHLDQRHNAQIHQHIFRTSIDRGKRTRTLMNQPSERTAWGGGTGHCVENETRARNVDDGVLLRCMKSIDRPMTIGERV